jgi:predicted anti-sigma-YlaC factor YlaD
MKAVALVLIALALHGCAVRQYALNRVADTIAEGGAAFASDDDPELIRSAAPFSLKLMESLLAGNPRHKRLLLAAARGFTQYAYAFVHQEAEALEERDVEAAAALEERARRMYRRARDYGLRGLALTGADPQAADVPLLYWTAASWAALISLSKSEPEALADLPRVEAMMDRALALDASFDRGAIHVFMIGYEPVRQGAAGDPSERSRAHFARAMQLSQGDHAAPYVALAEAVCVPQQRRTEFEALLREALRIDPARPKESQLANLVAQRRARWLLARIDRLFTN